MKAYEILWAGQTEWGGWRDTALHAEQVQGRRSDAIRERGDRGSLDTPAYSAALKALVDQGRLASLEINCRVGNQANYVTFTEGMSGMYTANVRANAQQIKALGFGPGGAKHLFEIQSEADLAKHDSGGPDGNRAFQRYVRGIFEAEGVDNVLYVCSLIQGGYGSNPLEWIDTGVIDVYGADGYSKPASAKAGKAGPGAKQSFESMFDACRRLAEADGKLWAVMESGCEEDPDDPAYKAAWTADKQAYCEAHSGRLAAVCDNYSVDGFLGAQAPWFFDTSPKALEAHRAWIGSPIWAGVAAPAPAPAPDPLAELQAQYDALQAAYDDAITKLEGQDLELGAAQAKLEAAAAELAACKGELTDAQERLATCQDRVARVRAILESTERPREKLRRIATAVGA